MISITAFAATTLALLIMLWYHYQLKQRARLKPRLVVSERPTKK